MHHQILAVPLIATQPHILLKGPALATAKQPRQALFRWFIEELRKLGYEERGEWPFNVDRLGYVTINTFISKVLAQIPNASARSWEGRTPFARPAQVTVSNAQGFRCSGESSVTPTSWIRAWW